VNINIVQDPVLDLLLESLVCSGVVPTLHKFLLLRFGSGNDRRTQGCQFSKAIPPLPSNLQKNDEYLQKLTTASKLTRSLLLGGCGGIESLLGTPP
jgi:hypothetical protein